MLFSKPHKAVGLDIGTHSVKAVQMSRHGGCLHVDGVGHALIDRDQVNVDPVEAHADAVREALSSLAPQNALVVGALPGQTVVIRYPRLPDVPEEQLAQSIESEAGQNIPYDLSEVFLDWSILDELMEGDVKQLKALLVAAKHEVIESRVQIADAADVQYGVLSVDSLAVADAAEGCDFLRAGETVALVNLGASSASIHFVKDGISNFIRDVSWGARELIQAIAKSERCDYDEAEKRLYEGGAALEEAPSPVEEAAPPPISAPAEEGGLLDGLDDGGLDVGGSLLDPLDDELGGGGLGDMGISPMGGSQAQPATLSEILALPVSRLVAEIRRSLDYYEHQLYELPVDRIILSGGVSHLPILRETILEEMAVSAVEVADPSASALVLGDEELVAPLLEHPAQFMVAVGLAARGMADL